ncbi:MAG TPA: SRPBCC family protein [Chitinivibrionales bacterium]|nr:SRPBCC family protein [Chitinivibrionales bacterium]
MTDSNMVTVHGDWLVHADRASVYAIVSDFERMPEHFPKIARSIRLLKRDGDVLTLEAEAGSFAAWLPSAKIELTVMLLPGQGYRCTTRNLTFNTTGDEELLLVDDPEGTRIKYTYFVTVRRRWFKPLFEWMVATFGLPFWKRSFVDPLESLVEARRDGGPMPAG